MRHGFQVYDTDTHVMPSSVDHVLGETSVKPETQKKLFWDNASQFYKQT
jgi:hypothetical protein